MFSNLKPQEISSKPIFKRLSEINHLGNLVSINERSLLKLALIEMFGFSIEEIEERIAKTGA